MLVGRVIKLKVMVRCLFLVVQSGEGVCRIVRLLLYWVELLQFCDIWHLGFMHFAI